MLEYLANYTVDGQERDTGRYASVIETYRFKASNEDEAQKLAKKHIGDLFRDLYDDALSIAPEEPIAANAVTLDDLFEIKVIPLTVKTEPNSLEKAVLPESVFGDA